MEHCPSNCTRFLFCSLLRSVSYDLDYVLCTIFVYPNELLFIIVHVSEILSTGTLLQTDSSANSCLVTCNGTYTHTCMHYRHSSVL